MSRFLKAVGRLLLQSSACQASIAGRWVVTLSTPWLRSSTAGRPRTPAAPTAVSGYFCRKGSHHVPSCQCHSRFGTEVIYLYILWGFFVFWIRSSHLFASEWSHSPVRCSQWDTHSHTWCLGKKTKRIPSLSLSHCICQRSLNVILISNLI